MLEINSLPDRSEGFRARLALAMARSGQNQSQLARLAGVDRSTISALLAQGSRMPNAQLAADIAAILDVSCDWLLGLSDHREPADRILAESVKSFSASRALFDETIFGWHQEAAGFKIRHVPATLPDLLKTPDVALWEYRDALGPEAEQAVAGFSAQLSILRKAQSDYEIAMPLDAVASFAQGTGYWEGLPLPLRKAQLDALVAHCEALYPSLRIYLYDARRVFSAPITVFGPRLAAIYLGRSYLAFRDAEKVAEISRHFDWLVREATLGARDAAAHFQRLRSGLCQ